MKNLEKNDEEPREKLLDCASCTRPLKVRYTEVQGQIVHRYYLCSTCPFLEAFLSKPLSLNPSGDASHLVCGNCSTSLLEVQRGNLLGCADCYDIFETYLTESLKEELPSNFDPSAFFHLGHKPGEFKEFGASLKIFALNETLNEMLHREDYEQAASIRDQIKELKKRQKKHD